MDCLRCGVTVQTEKLMEVHANWHVNTAMKIACRACGAQPGQPCTHNSEPTHLHDVRVI